MECGALGFDTSLPYFLGTLYCDGRQFIAVFFSSESR